MPSMLSICPVVRTDRCALVKAFVASAACRISATSAGSAAVVLTALLCPSESGVAEEHPDSHSTRQAPSITTTADATAGFRSFIAHHLDDVRPGSPHRGQ